MQTLRKKTSPCKYRNDPGRFFGDGVTFKAKLIGILEVGEARGDRMCQEALQDLKMAIRAAGEHKQRITIHVTIDGLRLRDEKTSDSLYHHPVHKISFIAQDMSDSRAFGYIFGSPDSGHRFFGIKTDKAASQVVLAMRDLFQVVFELKKKEIELARQHIQSKTIHEHQPVTLSVKSSTLEASSPPYNKTTHEPSTSKVVSSSQKEMSPESVADLVDLEQELSSIQRGITQMERITPSEPPNKATSEEDPFGDSFTHFPTYNLLPPPESLKSRHSKPLKPPDEPKPSSSPTKVTSTNSSIAKTPITSSVAASTMSTKQTWMTTTATTNVMASFEEPAKPRSLSVLDDNSSASNSQEDPLSATMESAAPPSTTNHYIDAFTDLDPLGTGKSKPYIDKKYFFQDLKNPPKKVLKDLSDQDSVFTANFGGVDLAATAVVDDFKKRNSSNEDDLRIFETSSALEQSTKSEFSNGTKGVEFNGQNFSKSEASTTAMFVMDKRKPDDAIIGNNKALLVTDNDPFSPRMKKFDPFDDDFNGSSIHDPFEFSFKAKSTTILPDTKITSDDAAPKTNVIDKKINDFNGPLQVNLPPEGYSNYTGQQSKRVERHNSDAGDSSSTGSTARMRPSVFKQNTVDVINSISTKKMKPHLFSQKYSKRESNSINMRRLQESDSLSENETAPEPPPRPDSSSHIEPPPLPPKKQFSDIIIRPRVTSPLATESSSRYDYVGNKHKAQADNTPALPLPSRKVGRTDSSYPGPLRPAKKGSTAIANDDDDYLTPIASELPILLPPPQAKTTSKNRGRRQPEPATAATTSVSPKPSPKMTRNIEISLPDITLSQLLTLGIDDLAVKLKVPPKKLSTMNIVELTQYLSDFVEKSSQKSIPAAICETIPSRTTSPPKMTAPEAAIFKVSFDQSSDATFIAKFDDNFGEHHHSFVQNFANFNDASANSTVAGEPAKSTAVDRYAVFREIMEQDLKTGDDAGDEEDNTNNNNNDDDDDINDAEQTNEPTLNYGSEEQNSDNESNDEQQPPRAVTVPTVIDTKITQAIAQAKDRYAALRDIILVEDLFDKSAYVTSTNASVCIETPAKTDDSLGGGSGDNTTGDSDNQKDTGDENQSSPEINISIDLDNSHFDNAADEDDDRRSTGATLTTNEPLNAKDDLEINEYMNRAISNLSLDSRDHLSPISLARSQLQNASTSPIRPMQQKETGKFLVPSPKTTLNDMSTSPIPLLHSARSPVPYVPMSKSPIDMVVSSAAAAMHTSKSPILPAQHGGDTKNSIGSLSDVVCGSSPEVDKNIDQSQPSESWAVFEAPPVEPPIGDVPARSPRNDTKGIAESPCSSDDHKNDWKTEHEYNKRWPRGHTSSSSRDLSPWDDDAPADYRRRAAPHPDRHGFYMRHARRMHSGDDDYEYEEEQAKRRGDRRMQKCVTSRSRETFDSGDAQNWYHAAPANHHSWSPPDENENGERASRQFERSSYERSTYGPPYEKREPQPTSLPPYDRKEYKNHEKRKYYRDYPRSAGYDIDGYGDDDKVPAGKKYYDDYEPQRAKGRRDYDDVYEAGFSRADSGGSRQHKSSKDYFYERDKRSFDRESNESYDSVNRRRKSYGSGDMYGSLDSREEFRERYGPTDKNRSLRKSAKPQRSNEEYDQDSDGEMVTVPRSRVLPGDSRSLQRPTQGMRPRKSSGSSPWDGEDLTPTSSQKSWKRPASASESDRRLSENRRVLAANTNTLPGSDGEKDRRFRKKIRSRGKEVECRPNYATSRHPLTNRSTEFGYEPPDYEADDSCSYRGGSRRKLDSAASIRTMTQERRRKDMFEMDRNMENMHKFSKSSRDVYYQSTVDKERFEQFDTFVDEPPATRPPPTSSGGGGGGNKFNFDDEQGFESDFNSPSNGGKALRFSNDFSEKDSQRQHHLSHGGNQQQQQIPTPNHGQTPVAERITPTGISQKLRFDDKITVSKFDDTADDMFEDDDFSKAEFSFENEDQWNAQLPKKNNLKSGTVAAKRQDNIKKSESVNIFAKKQDDPFEDDDFFKAAQSSERNGGAAAAAGNGGEHHFKWDKNFAKFDENI